MYIYLFIGKEELSVLRKQAFLIVYGYGYSVEICFILCVIMIRLEVTYELVYAN